MTQSFLLFTEVPVFDLATAENHPTKKSYMEWQPPATLDDVISAIEELNGNDPAAIMIETQIQSLNILGGPDQFMAVLADDQNFTLFSLKEKPKTEETVSFLVSGSPGKFSGHLVLGKPDIITLSKRLIQGDDLNSGNEFHLETKSK